MIVHVLLAVVYIIKLKQISDTHRHTRTHPHPYTSTQAHTRGAVH